MRICGINLFGMISEIMGFGERCMDGLTRLIDRSVAWKAESSYIARFPLEEARSLRLLASVVLIARSANFRARRRRGGQDKGLGPCSR